MRDDYNLLKQKEAKLNKKLEELKAKEKLLNEREEVIKDREIKVAEHKQLILQSSCIRQSTDTLPILDSFKGALSTNTKRSYDLKPRLVMP